MAGSLAGRIRSAAWAAFLAVLILAFGQGAWTALLLANLKIGTTIPWSVPAMALVLGLMWRYLGGKGWPRNTAEARRRYLRGRRVPGAVFAWALVAGVLSIAALAGIWIVMFQLFVMPGNVLPDTSKYSLTTLILLLGMASLVSPITEESAFRGYCQVILEREFRAPAAVLASSGLFALAHYTQGFYWPKLSVYFLAGLVFGVTAYLTQSILPGLAVHILADLTFFAFVWPYDTERRLVWEGGAGPWFWIHVGQALVFAGLAVAAYRRLAKVCKGPLPSAA